MTCDGCGKPLSFWSARPIAGRNYCGACAREPSQESGGGATGSTLRSVGWAMLVAGLFGLLWAAMLDVSVPVGGAMASDSYDRVSNLSLMSRKESLLLLFGFFSIVGAILATRGPRQS